MVFLFRFEGKRLSGAWHYMSDSWTEMPMTGVLVGALNNGGRVDLPDLPSAGRDLACMAFACSPRVVTGGGFDCGSNYDRCATSRDSLSSFSTATYQAAVEEKYTSSGRGASSSKALAETIVNALRDNKYEKLFDSLASVDDTLNSFARSKGISRQKVDDHVKSENQEEIKVLKETMKANIAATPGAWHQIRRAGERAGIIWSRVRFDRAELTPTGGSADFGIVYDGKAWLSFNGQSYTLTFTAFELRGIKRFFYLKQLAWKG